MSCRADLNLSDVGLVTADLMFCELGFVNADLIVSESGLVLSMRTRFYLSWASLRT